MQALSLSLRQNANTLSSMYESLMCLPYFQGMSKDEITSVLDKVKLEFIRYNDGQKIASQDSPCDTLTMLVRGVVTSTCISPDKSYTIMEEISTLFVFEPYSLFGKKPSYRCSYHAIGECDILTIKKHYLFSEFSKYAIFQMNLLNLLSQRAQQKNNQIWERHPESIPDKIINFVANRIEQQDGKKVVQIKMEDLANILGETRINISRTLNMFQQQGLIELKRKEIRIPSFKKLADTKGTFQ